MPFAIVREDLTRIHADAIVNAANVQLAPGGGVCGAIFKAAGRRELEQACQKLSPIQTGQAVATDGFNLPAKYIIHTAGPVYSMYSLTKSRRLLEDCYRNSLQLALDLGCKSIAFPLISSGIYGFPKEKALAAAVEVIEDFVMNHDMDVTLAVFDKDSFAISKKLLRQVESFISEHYATQHSSIEGRSLCLPDMPLNAIRLCENSSLQESLEQMEQPFADLLFSLIDQRGLEDSQVYKKANIDRKLFSKIRSIPGYLPKKKTILALAIALELNEEECEELLERAGYAFSSASKFDIIVQFFISKKRYNIFELNEVLFQYDQPLLGSLPLQAD